MDPKITEAAAYLADLRTQQRVEDDLPPELRPGDLEQAYAIADVLVEMLMHQSGARLAGYKVACTNPLAQDLLGVTGPIFGRLLSTVIVDSPARLDPAAYTRRIVEPEFAFVMAEAAPTEQGPYTEENIARKIGGLLPGLEIVDHRFTDWTRLGGPALAADNAYNGAWVRGTPYAGNWRELDLAGHPVTARHSNGDVLNGSGAAVMGHPLTVMAWLANTLNARGEMLKAGQYVTTGVATDILSCDSGEGVEADFGTLGTLGVDFCVRFASGKSDT